MSGTSDWCVPWPVCRRFCWRAPGGIGHHSYRRVTFSASQDDSPVLWRWRQSVSTKRSYNVHNVRAKSEQNIRCSCRSSAQWCSEVLRKGLCFASFQGLFVLDETMCKKREILVTKISPLLLRLMFSLKVFVGGGVVDAGDLQMMHYWCN